MSRDDGRRAALSRAVATCRRALVGDRKRKEPGDIGAQLEAPYGFDPKTGAPRAVEQMSHLRSSNIGQAEMLREWHQHLLTGAAGASEAERIRAAYDQMKYEIGFTILHRLAALRMAEERGIIQESVREGHRSAGFRVFLKLAGETGLGNTDEAYAAYLARLFDELARDLPGVFSRQNAASLITPGAKALGAVLDALNGEEIASLWGEDETLGWIFEDYNDADERKEMREHDAPRNARELAVRNQFFTPRWVVEFLTDNTLGRLWVELSGGETELVQSCRFLLKPKELPPKGCRDPRELKILDPACGSGHFLLYVYDLLEVIYREAWEGKHHKSPGLTPLWKEFPDEAAFRREIPRLILAHNLYGVDIDPRCIQEAGLALWLRAHRTWKALGLRAKGRPRIGVVNLVCAQSLSESPEIKESLRKKLKPPVLGRLVDALFLRVAEMGVLLRVETAIKETVESVKKDYLVWKQEATQRDLFGEVVGPRQKTLDEFAELRDAGADEAFWKDADRILLRTLEALAEEAEDKEYYRNRLFAEDVRHGLEFFDLCRIKFDVVLMNPPFGEPSENTKELLDETYPNAGHNLYTMFYERALEMLASGGRVGAITSRAWLALYTLGKFRQEVLKKKGTVELAADFGYGVLNAKVETAATVIREGNHPHLPATWIRLVKTQRKSDVLAEALLALTSHPSVSVVSAAHYRDLPTNIFGYWMSEALVNHYRHGTDFLTSGGMAKVGAESGDDDRYVRLVFEVRPEDVDLSARWVRIAKGGEYSPYWDDVHLAIRIRELGGSDSQWRRGNVGWFGRAGVTWQQRTNYRLSPRALPSKCAYGHKGPAAFSADGAAPGAVLAVLNSTASFLLLSARLQTADFSPNSISKSYEVSLVRDLPWPSLTNENSRRLTALAAEAIEVVRIDQIESDETGETVTAFALPPSLLPLPDGTRPPSLEAATRARVSIREDRLIQLSAIQAEIDTIVADAYGFSPRDRQVMDEELEPPLAALPGTNPIDEAQFRAAYLTKDPLDGNKLPGGEEAEMDVRVEHRRGKQAKLRTETTLCRLFQSPPARIADLRRRLALLRKEDQERTAADIVSYAVGLAFGRWDIRLWAHPEWIPTFADPFDPMPPCPLGQLVNAEGLPATEARIASEAWLAARKHPTTLPPGQPATWEIKASAYPLQVAWDGLLIDDTLHDAQSHRPPTSFLARVEAALEHLFGAARFTWEQDICEALGTASLADYLRTPAAFFADHLSRYSKSRRKAPIYWPLSTPSGSLTYWVYAPRFDEGTLPSIVNHLRAQVETLRDERDRLEATPGTDRTRQERLTRIKAEITERAELHQQLDALVRRGYAPHPDDGFVITASPFHFAFRLPKWRDELKATWEQLQKGDYDWAHLAMCFRPNEVLAACRTNRSIAIAHGKETLYQGAEPKKRAGKKTAPAKGKKGAAPAQTSMPGVDGAEEGENE
jgi:hypothetical protein